MSAVYSYKATDPALAKAVKAYFAKRQEVFDSGNKFAKLFGAKDAFFWRDGSFSYLGFSRDKPPKNEELWTKRDARRNGARNPKQGGGPEGKALRERWQKHWPKDNWREAETAWQTLAGMEPSVMHSPGLALIGRAVYIQTNKPLTAKGLVEITTSAHAAAVKKVSKL